MDCDHLIALIDRPIDVGVRQRALPRLSQLRLRRDGGHADLDFPRGRAIDARGHRKHHVACRNLLHAHQQVIAAWLQIDGEAIGLRCLIVRRDHVIAILDMLPVEPDAGRAAERQTQGHRLGAAAGETSERPRPRIATDGRSDVLLNEVIILAVLDFPVEGLAEALDLLEFLGWSREVARDMIRRPQQACGICTGVLARLRRCSDRSDCRPQRQPIVDVAVLKVVEQMMLLHASPAVSRELAGSLAQPRSSGNCFRPPRISRCRGGRKQP